MGTHLQTFTTSILSEVGFGSGTEGIDIEFVDQVDGQKKFCQIKMGPNTINKDDVVTINNHFKAIKNRAKTNKVSINLNDLIIGVLYGDEEELSSHYKKLMNDFHYPVFVGKEFWLRLTGDENFYATFINTIAGVAVEYDSTKLIQKTVKELASSEAIKKILES